jgi:hypothetical protein
MVWRWFSYVLLMKKYGVWDVDGAYTRRWICQLNRRI